MKIGIAMQNTLLMRVYYISRTYNANCILQFLQYNLHHVLVKKNIEVIKQCMVMRDVWQ